MKNQKIMPFKNVKTTEGNLTLGFDPKTNSFLHKTQKHITQVQPAVKKYPFPDPAYTKSSKLQPLPLKPAVILFVALHKNVRL